jgi:hypothetical protein
MVTLTESSQHDWPWINSASIAPLDRNNTQHRLDHTWFLRQEVGFFRSMSFQTSVSTNHHQQMKDHHPAPAAGGGRRAKKTILEMAISRLHELEINLVALDFDQTIIDIHTRGRWNGTSEELVLHVRPEIRKLMAACCVNNIQMCVVTFSGQVKIVRGVIESIVGPDRASRIPVRGSDRSWSYEGVGSRERKQPYIASAVEELEQMHLQPHLSHPHGNDDDEAGPPSSPRIEITRNSTLLIDDDPKNVRVALEDGVRAIWFNPAKPHQILQNIAKLV